MGEAIANKFLDEGHQVIGMDVKKASIKRLNYTHIQKDITSKDLPDIEGIEILVNDAGVQNSGREIDVNLKGTINITEKYGIQKDIKSIVFIASASARTGAEDKNGVNVSVNNTTAIPVYFKVVDDDTTSARFTITQRTGTVKVY